MPLGEYRFMSELFSGLQNVLPAWLPLPFPRPFVEGLDMAKYYDQVGGGIDHVSSFGKPTILGEARTEEVSGTIILSPYSTKLPLPILFFSHGPSFYLFAHQSD